MSALGNRSQEVATINRPRRPAPARPATRGRVLALAFAFALGALVAGGVVFGVTRPSSIEQAADRLRAESALRDRTQIRTLTELARGTRTRLLPVLDGLALALPGDGPAGPVAVTAADVEKWRQAAAAAVQGFADPPSGETATNVARSSLASAVRQFATTVDTYTMARDLTGPARAAALDLAARQRAGALFTWSIGATALDAVNIDAGYGHQHVFLPTSPGEGALTPDTEPEGSHQP
ncbi:MULTISPECIES: hypothetical protein [Nonomuraea]|uniref:Uncharacterized protein n=1 Tax=Nonomuraea ferruginea TaxID=46174 RepID=A0ABT4T0P7_9ACTN|nr:hypothetical protein [Nonomuraea ferruginea]MDA0643088.1 hypothetical protein [Nonomuraea ferruginea]